ncbi:hypothetical protein TNCV_2160321 [Trichonephila clavipes]|nr:hypothetical protein TNCV_2160321 [Trichonephila clavipes]
MANMRDQSFPPTNLGRVDEEILPPEKQWTAKYFGRSSGEGEAEYCSKSMKVVESFHLLPWNAPENGMENFTKKIKFQAASFAALRSIDATECLERTALQIGRICRVTKSSNIEKLQEKKNLVEPYTRDLTAGPLYTEDDLATTGETRPDETERRAVARKPEARKRWSEEERRLDDRLQSCVSS